MRESFRLTETYVSKARKIVHTLYFKIILVNRFFTKLINAVIRLKYRTKKMLHVCLIIKTEIRQRYTLNTNKTLSRKYVRVRSVLPSFTFISHTGTVTRSCRESEMWQKLTTDANQFLGIFEDKFVAASRHRESEAERKEAHMFADIGEREREREERRPSVQECYREKKS